MKELLSYELPGYFTGQPLGIHVIEMPIDAEIIGIVRIKSIERGRGSCPSIWLQVLGDSRNDNEDRSIEVLLTSFRPESMDRVACRVTSFESSSIIKLIGACVVDFEAINVFEVENQ